MSLPTCQAAAGTQVSVVNLDGGEGGVWALGMARQQLQTLAGCTPKMTEKTTQEEGLDFKTSQIHSMRVYGHCWEID